MRISPDRTSTRRIALAVAIAMVSMLPLAARGQFPPASGLIAGAEGAAAAAEAAAGARVVRIINVGTVLTEDGGVWVYRPDRGTWETLDDSFRSQGKETHIVPLPVTVERIGQMVTYGFILTSDGECWLYNMEEDRWQLLPQPPRL